MSEVMITLIRHGESLDNPIAIWAGWKDAKLSELGERQAAALGQYFSQTSPTHFDVIYASPLFRAFQTASAVHDALPSDSSKPPLIKNPHIREQHFGIAEGKPYLFEQPPPNANLQEDYYNKNIFPVSWSRDFSFPEGESLNDLAKRVDKAVEEIVVPHILESKEKGKQVHIAVTSHGLCIKELIRALYRLDPDYKVDPNEAGTFTSGLVNTGWTRVVLKSKSEEPTKLGIPPQHVEITLVDQKDHLANVAPAVTQVPSEQQSSEEGRALLGGGGSVRSNVKAGAVGASSKI